jgi:hypothetical protein
MGEVIQLTGDQRTNIRVCTYCVHLWL